MSYLKCISIALLLGVALSVPAVAQEADEAEKIEVVDITTYDVGVTGMS